MALSLFNKQNQNKKNILLIDVGSSSVGVALAIIENGHAPNIALSVREDIVFQEVLSSQRFAGAMNHALDKVLVRLQAEMKILVEAQGSKIVISDVFCTMSSPWFILKNRNLLISRQGEFEVTERTLEEFVNGDIELLKTELKEVLPHQDIKIIEKKIIHIKLNGYEIKNPYKQKTSRMELSVTVGVSSEKVVHSIESKIKGLFHTSHVHFGAFPVAAFSVIRDMFPTEKNFLFLDITGEATDVSRIDNDVLVKTASFPIGKNFFIREISTGLRTVHQEASSLFSMFLRDELDIASRMNIARFVEHAEEKWHTRFEKIISNLAEKGALPRKKFFTIDAEFAPFFSSSILKIKSKLLMGGSFEVQYLDQLIVSKFVSFDPEISRDPYLVVEALFAEKILAHHDQNE
ncbi:MAG: hypothetical protein Q7K40_02910 [bacterium]|nr:hypothetical protein [bacterium]